MDKKNRRIMRDQEQYVNLVFHPQVGLGKIDFSFNEKDIITLLGEPEDQDIDSDLGANCYSITLWYFSLGISPKVYYENNELDYLSISSDDLLIENTLFSTLSKSRLLFFIKSYCKRNNFNSTYKKTVDDIRECYYFEGIGLTIWFEKGKISNIIVESTLYLDDEVE